MYELKQIGPRTYYFPGPAQVGVFDCGDGTVCLIDGGSDKDAARRMLRAVTEQGWQVRAVCNTHSHADHIGGNRYWQEQTGCRIFAPGIECAFTRQPIMESTVLFGAFPPDPLRHKFLLAQPSDAELLTPEVLPAGLTFFPLPGHCMDMVGYDTCDGVAFMADSLCSADILNKYHMTYVFDVGTYLETLRTLPEHRAALYVPAHVPVLTDLRELVQINEQAVYAVGQTLCELCAAPLPTDEVIARACAHYNLHMNFQQYALEGSTVRSYLSWLYQCGRMRVIEQDPMLLWQTAEA